MQNQFGDADLMIVKVGSDCSIDLLHFAKLHNIPTLHDVDTVLMCKNKVALDQAIRKIFDKHSGNLENFLLPKSWTQSLQKINRFKEWAFPKLPIGCKVRLFLSSFAECFDIKINKSAFILLSIFSALINSELIVYNFIILSLIAY